MTIKRKLTTAIATGAILLNAMAPIALAQTITVNGNGAFSDNEVNIKNKNETVVNQTNDAKVTNNIDADASTGGNSASFNTGGKTIISTGDASTNVDVTTAVNLNKVDLPNCGTCDRGPVNVTISGNGANPLSENKSEPKNEVNVNTNNSLFVNQNNYADIDNYVDAKATTGKNDASLNTGGDSIISTGDAKTNVSINNIANANFAKVGGNNSNTAGSDIAITGNGAGSDNEVDLKLNSLVTLDQHNLADIDNDVYAKAKTGHNDSQFNTGGETVIITGNAKTNVGIDNLVNFNAADVDCGCILEDLNLKIGGNGAGSDNKIEIDTKQSLFDTQHNLSNLYNDVDSKAKTGHNDVSFSTGTPENDPAIVTGNAFSSTDVNNAGNVNILDNGENHHFDGKLENLDFGFEFDLGQILSFLHLG